MSRVDSYEKNAYGFKKKRGRFVTTILISVSGIRSKTYRMIGYALNLKLNFKKSNEMVSEIKSKNTMKFGGKKGGEISHTVSARRYSFFSHASFTASSVTSIPSCSGSKVVFEPRMSSREYTMQPSVVAAAKLRLDGSN